jgi:glycosyltransferase involved in cell wall biosynthesis
MAQRPSLSAAIITYNESENIRDCLDSIADFVDEIVVVDSYSTDDTEQICRSFPKVKFYQHPFDGHLPQKNRALDLCTSQWVLSLDADERVTPQLRRSIETFLSADPSAAGAKFPRLTYHMHKFIRHGGWYPNARYRLVQKGKARWGGKTPHEKLILHGRGKKLTGDLLHYTARDLSDQVATINAFSSITALTRYNKGKRFHLWRLLVKPITKFIEMYCAKFGFLDGMQGFIIAVSSSYSSFLKEAKLYELDVLGSEKPSNLSPLYTKKR